VICKGVGLGRAEMGYDGRSANNGWTIVLLFYIIVVRLRGLKWDMMVGQSTMVGS
jgi:hypothetical protein